MKIKKFKFKLINKDWFKLNDDHNLLISIFKFNYIVNQFFFLIHSLSPSCTFFFHYKKAR